MPSKYRNSINGNGSLVVNINVIDNELALTTLDEAEGCDYQTTYMTKQAVGELIESLIEAHAVMTEEKL